MEASLGRGYSINEEFGMTDFYSPPSSVIDDIDEHEDDLCYTENGEQDESLSIVPIQDTALPDSLLEDINTLTLANDLNNLKLSSSLKLIPTGTTPPPTPMISYRPFLPSSSTTTLSTTTTIGTSTISTPSTTSTITTPTNFLSMTLNNPLSMSSSRNNDALLRNWPLIGSTTDVRTNNNLLFSRPMENSLKTNGSISNPSLLTPTSIDRYFADNRHLSDSHSRSSSTLDLPLSMIGSASLSNNRPSSLSNVHPEMNHEISRLYSYMSPVDELASTVRTATNPSWSTSDESLPSLPIHSRLNNNSFTPHMNLNSGWTSRVNSFVPNLSNSINSLPNFQHQQTSPTSSMMNPFQNPNSLLLSEVSAILRQNQQQQQQQSMVTFNNNITLSSTAQQILAANVNGGNNNNNRPLRSEKIDIEIIKHLIREAKLKRQCGLKKEVCVFCRNNGENELIYSSHSLKDSLGNVTCPILRAYQCPICGATGAQAHTIKYCQATGDDNNQHIPTPYEKMIRTQCMQTFGLDESLTSAIPTLFDPLAASPSSLYSNGWSNSYL